MGQPFGFELGFALGDLEGVDEASGNSLEGG